MNSNEAVFRLGSVLRKEPEDKVGKKKRQKPFLFLMKDYPDLNIFNISVYWELDHIRISHDVFS